MDTPNPRPLSYWLIRFALAMVLTVTPPAAVVYFHQQDTVWSTLAWLITLVAVIGGTLLRFKVMREDDRAYELLIPAAGIPGAVLASYIIWVSPAVAHLTSGHGTWYDVQQLALMSGFVAMCLVITYVWVGRVRQELDLARVAQ